MGTAMRRLLTFDAAGAALAGSFDAAHGDVGLLMVTGGTQTRVGSHRMYERLAASLAASGHPCFRFDRRGVGDSEGEDPGFRGSTVDINAAACTFRTETKLRLMIGVGLCDGATALMLFGREAKLDGLILINPWLVEAESGAPPPAAIRQHYRDRLASLDGWRRLFTGQVSLLKLVGGLRRVAAPPRSDLGQSAISTLIDSRLPARLILARKDATAIAAEEVWRSGAGIAPRYIESDSHTFARPGDLEALKAAVLAAITDLSGE